MTDGTKKIQLTREQFCDAILDLFCSAKARVKREKCRINGFEVEIPESFDIEYRTHELGTEYRKYTYEQDERRVNDDEIIHIAKYDLIISLQDYLAVNVTKKYTRISSISDLVLFNDGLLIKIGLVTEDAPEEEYKHRFDVINL